MARTPSWSDFATHDRARFPELWEGCVFAAAPCLGPTGGVLYDLSRRQLPGTLTSMTPADDWVVSSGQYALDFASASNQYVAYSGNILPSSPFSICCWINTSTFSNNVCMSSSNTSATRSNAHIMLRSSTSVRMGLFGDDSDVTVPSMTSAWTHLVFVMRADNSRSLFYNGVRYDGTAAAGAYAGTGSPTIGALRSPGVGFAFNGLIDDVRFYSRDIGQSEARLLASRRGIAYEPRPRLFRGWVPEQGGATDYPLDAGSGTFTLSGQSVDLTVARTLDAGHGTFALSGQDVDLSFGRVLDAGQGSYSLSGQDVDLSLGLVLDVGQGTFTLTGQDVELTVSRVLDAGSGTFALTGQSVSLEYSGEVAAGSVSGFTRRVVRGTIDDGYAPRDGFPAHPELWRGCIAAWAPCLGVTGSTVYGAAVERRRAVLTNMDAATDWVVSQGQYALDFDGTNDRLAVDPITRLESLTSYTFAVWVNAANVVGNKVAIGYRSNSTGNPILGSLEVNGSDARFLVRDDAGTLGNAVATSAISANQWIHICGIRSGNNVSIIVNGRTKVTATPSLGTITANTLGLGASVQGTVNYSAFFSGLLDDFRIYDRALNDSEVALLATRRGVAFDRIVRRAFTYRSGNAFDLDAGSGTFSLSGQDVTLTADRMLDAGQGSYAIVGQDVQLNRGLMLDAGAGTYTLSGQDVTLRYSGAFAPAPYYYTHFLAG